ncbi:MAG: WYL domain-containing protein [Pseudomonadaceae bacterium]
MPSNSYRRTLARQWELLKLLPSKQPGLTAADLQQRLRDAGHETSKRTVERDLIELSSLFPLQRNDKGTPYGWHWMPGSASALPGLSLSDALTLQLLEGNLTNLIPCHMMNTLEPRFQQARQKLQALSEEVPSASWIDKVAIVQPELTLVPPSVSEQILEETQEALLHGTQLKCIYYAAHKDRQHHFTLNPLALVQRSQVTYLLATVEPFEDIRQFALHRFRAAEQTSMAVNKPSDFNLPGYLASGAMQFGTPAKIEIEAWVNDGLRRLLEETPLSNDMRLSPEEDGARLTAVVNDSWELRWWILSHAGSIQIRSPASLAGEISQRLEQALQLQSKETP